ncbi:MAG: protein phosphatase 2C domain-containing protein [Polyangiales bacterium]
MPFAYGLSHVGRRQNNEDAFCIAPHLGLYAVADGMGGYHGGEVASRLVVESLLRFFEETTVITDGRAAASRLDGAIRSAATSVAREAEGELAEMGSTVAAVWLKGSNLVVAHVGDSRVYRLRNGKLEQLTRDHSVYAELEAAGKWHVIHALRGQIEHMVTRCIAADIEPQAEIQLDDARPGDLYLLCSDGLTDVLSNFEIEQILKTHGADGSSDALVRHAYAAGSTDNITAVVVGVPTTEA